MQNGNILAQRRFILMMPNIAWASEVRQELADPQIDNDVLSVGR